ncbi:universal stress protein [Modestobacter sp. SSW1-42]|uniref:universal stress protein n=1 Tax=Modestobacter sp. SSW1-42 TaxID=596372 RepID=UPI0039874A54
MSEAVEGGARPSPESDDDRAPRVVVGVDGSPGSRAALVYAFAAAARRGAHLDVVATFSVQAVWIGGYPLGMPMVSALREGTETRAQDLVDQVRHDPALAAVPGAADVPTRLIVSVGPAAQRLVDTSATADLLVVGSRGRGAVRSVLLGSVALHCVTHAHCPVAVVHPTPAGHRQDRTVVVGVDGSAASRTALEAAVAEAARLDTGVAVVTAYELADHWVDLTTVVVPSEDQVRWELQRGAEAMVDDVLAAHRAGTGGPAPFVEVVVTEGPAADVLLRWGADAALLVVGARGRSELRGLLAGSVALACAMHGAGPVLVVRPTGDRAGAAPAARAVAGA